MNPQHIPPPQDDPLLLAAVFRLLKSMRGDRVLIGVQEARSVTTKEVIKRQVLSEGAADRYWWSALWSVEMMDCFQETGKELHRTVSNGFLGRSSSVLNGCRVVYNRALTKLSGQEGNFYLSSQAEHLRRCLEDGIILRECELDSDQCVSQEQFQRRSHNCRTRERNNLPSPWKTRCWEEGACGTSSATQTTRTHPIRSFPGPVPGSAAGSPGRS